jgi:DNA-binding transcriptional LysR family regulator
MLVDITEMALEQKKFEPALSRKVFTLIASDFVQFAIMSSLADSIRRSGPDIALIVKPANPEKIFHLMESGQVDLGIGYLPDPPEQLRTRLLFGENQVCLIRKNHPALKREWTKTLYSELTHVSISPGGSGIYGAAIDRTLKSQAADWSYTAFVSCHSIRRRKVRLYSHRPRITCQTLFNVYGHHIY